MNYTEGLGFLSKKVYHKLSILWFSNKIALTLKMTFPGHLKKNWDFCFMEIVMTILDIFLKSLLFLRSDIFYYMV